MLKNCSILKPLRNKRNLNISLFILFFLNFSGIMNIEIREIKKDESEINAAKDFLFNQIDKEYHIGPTPKFHYDIFDFGLQSVEQVIIDYAHAARFHHKICARHFGSKSHSCYTVCVLCGGSEAVFLSASEYECRQAVTFFHIQKSHSFRPMELMCGC